MNFKNAFVLLLFFFFLLGSTFSFAGKQDFKFGEYKVGPGDVFQVYVWQDERLNQKFVVPPDGIVVFPLIGVIDTNGMTLVELQETFRKKLSRFIPDVIVTVMPVEIHSSKVYVIGKVKNSGEYPIDARTDVVQAIAMAGGLTPFANKSKILVLRRGSDGKIQKFEFDYSSIEKGRGFESNIILKPGDVVVVP